MRRATGLVDLACQRCALSKGRTQVVPAEGRRGARLFLVGEAPGPDEDAIGRPFVGRAGRILRRCLERAGIAERDVWITNVVKCFPHTERGGRSEIRRPTGPEAEACRSWLLAELDAVRPRLLVAVGLTAAEELTGQRGLRLSQARGRLLPTRAELGPRKVLVTYHPSGLHYGHATEGDLVRDLRRAKALADRASAPRPRRLRAPSPP